MTKTRPTIPVLAVMVVEGLIAALAGVVDAPQQPEPLTVEEEVPG